ncbi:MAG: enoyl-CoA hydratase/isomerase family protein [Myxococcota bacterium]
MTVRIARVGPVMKLTVARPEAKNAIDAALAEALIAALEAAGADDGVAAVSIEAEGDVFLAGGDVRVLDRWGYGRDGADAVLALGAALTRAVEGCPVPVVAAADGPVFGGGAELFVACDATVLAEDAVLRFVHVGMGLVPAWGGVTRLIERVGVTRATELLLTGRGVSGSDAAAMGLVTATAPSGGATARAATLVGEMTAHPRPTLAAMKRALLGVRRARREGAGAAEAHVFRDVWGAEPHREAFARFLRGRG